MIQHISLRATSDGTLTAVRHAIVGETSTFEDCEEVIVNWSGQSYACANAKLTYKAARLGVGTPLDMRVPAQ